MASEVIKIIDPDSGAGTDYTTLDAWEDALGGTTGGGTPGDLPAGDEIAVAQCRASSGTNDTAAVVINGWTTDSTRFIKITNHSDETNTGIWNEANYVLDITDDEAIYVQEDFVTIDNVQIELNTTGSNSGYGIRVQSVGTATITISNCIIKGGTFGTLIAYGILINDASATVNIWNTIVYDVFVAADGGFRGIYCDTAIAVNIWNCTVYNCTRGIQRDAGTCTAINTIVGNCEDDWNGTFVASYCCDDDDEGTNNQDPSGGSWANEFETAGSDFRLKAGGNCIGNGTDDPGGALQDDDDIAGTARTSTWDIGAFENVAAVVGNAGIMTTNTGFWGPTF